MYIGSLFVPRRVAENYLSFLVDTGCTHNLLSRTVFDRLPAQSPPADGLWRDRGGYG